MHNKSMAQGKGKIEKVMHEWKQGKLQSSAGSKVKSQRQAVAIAMSEARKAGQDVPEQKAGKKTLKDVVNKLRHS